MDDNLLKEALREAMLQDLTEIPDEAELKSDYEFSQEFETKMNHLVAKTNKRYVTVGRYTIRKKVLVALIAAILLLTGCIAIKPVREAVIDFFVERNEKNSDITFSTASDTGDVEFIAIIPKKPKGYATTKEVLLERYYEIEYRNKKDEFISYTQIVPSSATTVMIDTEGVQVYDIEINGYKGIKYTKRGENNILWTDECYFYDLIGTCEMSVLEEIAENMMKNKK